MNRLLIILLLLALFLAGGLVLAAPNATHISWWTVDCGGAVPVLSGGAYGLQGTSGQADVGVLSNGRYTLNGGYWNRTMATYTLYLPITLKP